MEERLRTIMFIKNPFSLPSSKYTRKNVRIICWSTRLSTGIYIYDKVYYNLRTGNVSYFSNIYISPYYRDKWYSYSTKWKQEKQEMKEHNRKEKFNYMRKNMMRMNFSTYLGYKTLLREAVVYNIKTGVVSYTSFFEQKKC